MLMTDIKSLPLYICKLFVIDDMEHHIISWSDKNLYLRKVVSKITYNMKENLQSIKLQRTLFCKR